MNKLLFAKENPRREVDMDTAKKNAGHKKNLEQILRGKQNTAKKKK